MKEDCSRTKEVKATFRTMGRGKTVGEDGLAVEMIEVMAGVESGLGEKYCKWDF